MKKTYTAPDAEWLAFTPNTKLMAGPSGMNQETGQEEKNPGDWG